MLLKKNLKIKLVLKENIVTLCNFSINSSEYSRFHDPASLACFSRDLANVFSTNFKSIFCFKFTALVRLSELSK